MMKKSGPEVCGRLFVEKQPDFSFVKKNEFLVKT